MGNRRLYGQGRSAALGEKLSAFRSALSDEALGEKLWRTATSPISARFPPGFAITENGGGEAEWIAFGE